LYQEHEFYFGILQTENSIFWGVQFTCSCFL